LKIYNFISEWTFTDHSNKATRKKIRRKSTIAHILKAKRRKNLLERENGKDQDLIKRKIKKKSIKNKEVVIAKIKEINKRTNAEMLIKVILLEKESVRVPKSLSYFIQEKIR